MDFMSNMLAPLQWPASGAWETIIKWLSGVGNIAVAIILLTLILKLLLLPVDFWQRSVTRKMSLKQAEMQPELEKIKQKYGNSELGQQKTAELYKKHGMSPTSSCGVMLVYMVLTLLVFITLFNSLGSISRTQINYEYYQLQTEYSVVYKQSLAETDYDTSVYDSVEAYAKAIAQNAVVSKYDEVRQGFLWIKNIWRPDNWSSVFPTADEFLSTTGSKFYVETNTESEFYNMVMLSTDTSVPYVDVNGNVYAIPSADPSTDPSTIVIEGYETPCNIVYADTTLVTEEKNISRVATETASAKFKADFDVVTAGINQKYNGQWNGYLILIILSGAITFLSQFLSTVGVKGKDKKGNEVKGAKTKWISGAFLAVLMIVFTIGYTSMFALYIVTNSILSIIFNILINLINNKIDSGKEKKKTKTVVADYVRVE